MANTVFFLIPKFRAVYLIDQPSSSFDNILVFNSSGTCGGIYFNQYSNTTMAATKFATIVRNISRSNVTNQMIKPPIHVGGIEGRYASALYSAGTKQKNLDIIEKELTKFQDMLKTDTKLSELISDPTITRAEKADALKHAAKQASFSSACNNFLQLLAENNRLKKLDAVIMAFKLIMSVHRGEVQCEVITAKELDKEQRQKLESVLKLFVKPNEGIHVIPKVDPNIIGGMIVTIGDRYIDMSVASKIKKYTALLNAPVFRD